MLAAPILKGKHKAAAIVLTATVTYICIFIYIHIHTDSPLPTSCWYSYPLLVDRVWSYRYNSPIYRLRAQRRELQERRQRREWILSYSNSSNYSEICCKHNYNSPTTYLLITVPTSHGKPLARGISSSSLAQGMVSSSGEVGSCSIAP